MDDCSEVHSAVRGLKTVCRCNNVKYRTLERCIRDGATTINQIAARTMATTGYCGGSCTPDIQQMIADLAPKRAQAAVAAPPEGWWVRKN